MMKKLFTLSLLLMYAIGLQAQSQRKVLWEQFTSNTCGPCASFANTTQYKTFRDTTTRVIIVKYHQNFPSPGTDQFYADNPSEMGGRWSYNIQGLSSAGIPMVAIDGGASAYRGHPICLVATGVSGCTASPTDLTNEINKVAPLDLQLNASLNTSGDSVIVNVKWTVTQTLTASAAGRLRLNLLAVDSLISFSSAPGTNGQTKFDYVVRKMITGLTGQTIKDSYAIGDVDSATVAWKISNMPDPNRLRIVGFIQDYGTRNIHNAERVAVAVPFQLSLAAAPSTNLGRLVSGTAPVSFDFNANVQNAVAGDYKFFVDKSALPTGWSANFVIDGTTYPDTASLSLGANPNKLITVVVTPTSDPGKGIVKIAFRHRDQLPSYMPQLSATVFANVNTLLINLQASKQTYWDTRLNTLGRPHVTMLGSEIELVPVTDFTKTNTPRIIYNASKAIGGVLDDARFQRINAYLADGGRVMAIGQDIGYVYSNTSTGAGRTFYSSYLGAAYIRDGGASNAVSANTDDFLYSPISTFEIDISADPTNYMDRIRVAGTGAGVKKTLYYDPDVDSIAGLRKQASTYKTAYIPFALDYSLSQADADTIIARTLLWFDDLISEPSVSRDELTQSRLFGQLYPNPASDAATLPFENLDQDYSLQVVDALGRVLSTHALPAGTRQFSLPTQQLSTGIYQLRILDGERTVAFRKLNVKH